MGRREPAAELDERLFRFLRHECCRGLGLGSLDALPDLPSELLDGLRINPELSRERQIGLFMTQVSKALKDLARSDRVSAGYVSLGLNPVVTTGYGKPE